MAFQQFKAEVQNVSEIAKDVREVECKLVEPKSIEFKAGQFLMLNIPNDEGKVIKRAYSIASSPTESEHLVFVIKLLPGGAASAYVQSLKAGDEVLIDGPMGHFHMEAGDNDLLFIGTGTGIAPLSSMTLHNIDRKDSRKMTLLFGVRSEEDIFWQDKFEGLANENSNLNYEVTLSQPSDEWVGEKGRVTDYVQNMELDPENLTVYLCGSKPMVEEVLEILKEKGLSEENVKKEVY